jgi:CheY-like chemotaxis protein
MGDDLTSILHTQRGPAPTRPLLTFPERPPGGPCGQDLNSLVRDWAGLLRNLLGEAIDMQMDLAPGLPPVRADAGRLLQALIHLASCVRTTLAGGGQLVLATSPDHPTHAPGLPVAGSRPGEAPPPTGFAGNRLEPPAALPAVGGPRAATPSVLLQLRYRGGPGEPGGPPPALEPAAALLDQVGGRLEAGRTPDGAGTLTLALPGAGQPPPRATVLVVDDTGPLCTMLGRVLTLEGHDVLTAADGREALTLVEQRPRPVDLLVTDLMMPVLDGRQLAERLRARWPELPVIFVSGFVDPFDDAPPGPGCVFLHKPFGPHELLRAVRGILRRA